MPVDPSRGGRMEGAPGALYNEMVLKNEDFSLHVLCRVVICGFE